MMPVWMALFVLAAVPGGDSAAPASRSTSPPTLVPAARSEEPHSPLRQAQELRREVSLRLRREATTSGAENEVAVRELLALFQTLQDDTALTDDERQRLLGKLRSRLERVSRRLRRQAARAATNTKAPAQAAAPASSGASSPEEPLKKLSEESSEELPGELPQKFGSSLANRTAPAALGGRAADDHGPELVELIQAVIAPQSWESNGGPGSIHYYRPLRALVIRQSTEVHDQVSEVIEQLRR